MTKPIKKVKAGSVSIAVFENKGKDKTGKEYSFLSCQLQRGYKDKTGNWVNESCNFRKNEISNAILVLEKAFEFMAIRDKAEE